MSFLGALPSFCDLILTFQFLQNASFHRVHMLSDIVVSSNGASPS